MDSTSDSCNLIRFRLPYRQQNWSLPESIIHYIAKNPSSAKDYQKLICSCKYFFAKFPITVCKDFVYNSFHDRENDELEVKDSFEIKKFLHLNNILNKLWITNNILIETDEPDKRNLASSAIPYIYRCDAEYLCLWNQNISFKDFLFLSKNALYINIECCDVKNEDGSIVSIEKLVEHSPQALTFKWDFGDGDLVNISSESVKSLVEIPHFKTLMMFKMSSIPDTFDLATFCDYIKKNQNTRIWLNFSETISEDFEDQLETLINELLEAPENCGYKIPVINFEGLEREKADKLYYLYCK